MSLGIDIYQEQRELLIAPFIQVFDQSASKFKSQFNINETLDVMFPDQKRQDKDLAKVKEALGELFKEFTVAELKAITTDIDFLVTTWLDDFERSIFDNQTLAEALHERGGVL